MCWKLRGHVLEALLTLTTKRRQKDPEGYQKEPYTKQNEGSKL